MLSKANKFSLLGDLLKIFVFFCNFCRNMISGASVASVRSKVPDSDMRARRGLRLSALLSTSVCHPSQKIRVSTVCPEPGKEAISSGFEPAKSVVRGLPTATPTAILPSSEYLGVLRPIRAVATTFPLRESMRDAPRPLMDWLREGRTRVGREGASRG